PAAAPAYKAPVLAPTPAYNWTGFYIGASVGGEWETIDGSFVNPPPASWSVSNDARGMWDAHVGAQYQWNSVVFGVEGNFVGLFNNDNGKSVSCNPATSCALGATLGANLVDNIWTVGGKLGWAFGPWMAYASGGYANARVDNTLFTAGGLAFESTPTRHDRASHARRLQRQGLENPRGAPRARVGERDHWVKR